MRTRYERFADDEKIAANKYLSEQSEISCVDTKLRAMEEYLNVLGKERIPYVSIARMATGKRTMPRIGISAICHQGFFYELEDGEGLLVSKQPYGVVVCPAVTLENETVETVAFIPDINVTEEDPRKPSLSEILKIEEKFYEDVMRIANASSKEVSK